MAVYGTPTPGNDFLTSNDEADTIDALAGNDTVNVSGSDTVNGSEGDDRINAYDIMDGETISIMGDAGNDQLRASLGSYNYPNGFTIAQNVTLSMDGGDDNDYVSARDISTGSVVTLTGGAGEDNVRATTNSEFSGTYDGDGNRLSYTDVPDSMVTVTINGGDDNDNLRSYGAGEGSTVSISGDGGDDNIRSYGGRSRNATYELREGGGTTRSEVNSSSSANQTVTLAGGEGDDNLSASGLGDGSTIAITGDAGEDGTNVSGGQTRATTYFENYYTATSDTASATNLAVTINGGADNDYARVEDLGNGSSVTITGDDGDDTARVYGGDSSQNVNAQIEDETAYYGVRTESVSRASQAATGLTVDISGGEGNDRSYVYSVGDGSTVTVSTGAGDETQRANVSGGQNRNTSYDADGNRETRDAASATTLNVTLTGGGTDDYLSAYNVGVGSTVSVTGDAGDDDINVRGGSSSAQTYATTEETGTNRLTNDNTAPTDLTVTIDGGAGNDDVDVSNVGANSTVSVTGDAGEDNVDIRGASTTNRTYSYSEDFGNQTATYDRTAPENLSVTVAGGEGDDVVNVREIGNGSTVSVMGDEDCDNVYVNGGYSSTRTTMPSTDFGLVTASTTNTAATDLSVTVGGGALHDRLFVNNVGDNSTVSVTGDGGEDIIGIDGGYSTSSTYAASEDYGSVRSAYARTAAANLNVTATGGEADDDISVSNVGAGSTVSVTGDAGEDSINIRAGRSTTDAYAESAKNGNATTASTSTASGDLTVTASGGEADDQVSVSGVGSNSTVTVSGEAGDDNLSVSGGSSSSTTFADTSGGTVRSSYERTSASNLTVMATGGEGDDNIDVDGVGSNSTVTITGDAGDDNIDVYAASDQTRTYDANGSTATTTTESATSLTINVEGGDDCDDVDIDNVGADSTVIVNGGGHEDNLRADFGGIRTTAQDDSAPDTFTAATNVTVTMSGGNDDDTVRADGFGDGSTVTLTGDAGDDRIDAFGGRNTTEDDKGRSSQTNPLAVVMNLSGGEGDDDISAGRVGDGSTVTISGDAGDDSIDADFRQGYNPDTDYNQNGSRVNVTLSGGDGDDNIDANELGNGSVATFTGDAGKDDIDVNGEAGSTITADGGADNDSVSVDIEAEPEVDEDAEEGEAVEAPGVTSVDVKGGDGDDFLDVDVDADNATVTISGDAGDDSLRIYGAYRPEDELEGLIGVTATMTGGEGDDDFGGGLGDGPNTLIGDGGVGDDDGSLGVGDGGTLTFTGGDGEDDISGNGGDMSTVTVTGDAGDDDVFAGGGEMSTVVASGGAGDDTIRANGEDGATVTASGGDGDDSLSSSSDKDATVELNGGGGDDTLSGSRADDRLIGGGGDDEAFGGRGADNIGGNGGEDILNGGKGQDTLRGNGGQDELSGNSGADELRGGGGNDELSGGRGADMLFGGGGSDAIAGGKGNDELTGNGGADFFIFTEFALGTDTITDFGRGGADRMVVGVDDFGDVNVRQTGADTTVSFAGNKVVLEGVNANTINANDFIFDDGVYLL